jgi:formylglycine-generating enzyme required for sulfatase activity
MRTVVEKDIPSVRGTRARCVRTGLWKRWIRQTPLVMAVGVLCSVGEPSVSPVDAAAAAESDAANQSHNLPALWTNSLDMVLVQLPGTRVWLGRHETRVRDYAAFVARSDVRIEPVRWRLGYGGWELRTWRQPGFNQSSNHPVVFVSYEDAAAFCQWLTRIESDQGRLRKRMSYRLPTDAEWSLAAGPQRYPWMETVSPSAPTVKPGPAGRNIDPDLASFPPPAGAGNYAGTELSDPSSSGQKTLRGYRDGFPQTAPVESFAPNHRGFFDLGGNVAEWCLDWYRKEMLPNELDGKVPFFNNDGGGSQFRVVRGASWIDSHPAVLRTDCRFYEFPDQRGDAIGFRVALVEAAD